MLELTPARTQPPSALTFNVNRATKRNDNAKNSRGSTPNLTMGFVPIYLVGNIPIPMLTVKYSHVFTLDVEIVPKGEAHASARKAFKYQVLHPIGASSTNLAP